MEGFWSLVLFTILGQAAAGMIVLKTIFDRTTDRLPVYVATWLLIAGALISLGHLPTVPFWNSSITFFLVDAISTRQDKGAIRRLLTGWKPVVIVLGLAVRMVLVPLQVMKAQGPVNTVLLDAHVTLLVLGAGLGCCSCATPTVPPCPLNLLRPPKKPAPATSSCGPLL